MQLIPHLHFDGQCAEAFELYREALDGRIEVMQTHGDSPIAGEVPPEWHDRILHARLVADDAILIGADSPPGFYERPQGISVALQTNDPERAERIFHALAEQGKVTMPLGKSFWAERFGMVVDRYGILWMISGGLAE